jgi:hypothetical protein
MDALLGLAVLTSPLLLLLVWLPVSIWLASKLVKWIGFKNGVVRFVAVLPGFVLVFMLPFADEIAGQIYLEHLCRTEAGVKVYQTVELPAEYWDGQGKPRFFNEHGFLEHKFWVSTLDESGGKVERYSPVFAIDKNISPVKEKSSQKMLAEITTFRFWGGWVSRNFSPHNTASSCEFIQASDFSRNFYGQLFKSATSTR